jgi:hypothetical protein
MVIRIPGPLFAVDDRRGGLPSLAIKSQLTNTQGVSAIQFTLSGKLPQYLIVLGTKPRGAGVSFVDHFAILVALPAQDQGVSDITDLFVGKYGMPRAGSRVFIQVIQQIDGWQDLPKQLSARVPAA